MCDSYSTGFLLAKGAKLRVLVIGGTGFIGPWVVRRLHAEGHAVTVCHRGNTESELPPDVSHLHHRDSPPGDRSFLADHAGEFERLRPEVVLDMRPVTEQEAVDTVAAFRGIAGRLVAVSSRDVYRAYGLLQGTETGPPDGLPLTEDSPLELHPHPKQPVR
jgi:nucleoside-diphosphate-sugar epimerase